MNQSIAGIVWPACLRQLSFRHAFDQPITGVAWPTSLQELAGSVPLPRSDKDTFNQPMVGVLWPVSLKIYRSGMPLTKPSPVLRGRRLCNSCCSGHVSTGASPGLHRRHYMAGFHATARMRVLLRPANLQSCVANLFIRIRLENYRSDISSNKSSPGLSLQQLLFGTWGSTGSSPGLCGGLPVQRLKFGDRFNQPINGVVWPASLQLLEVGRACVQPKTITGMM